MWQVLLDTPWKAVTELKRLIYHPFVIIYLKLKGVKIGQDTKWYGFPTVFRHKNSQIVIGDRVEVRNWVDSNPLGINHRLILTTWKSNSQIIIADDVGISGGTICAASEIQIGKGSLIGANCTIIDTDFHPTSSSPRRYSQDNIKTSPVKLGENVFLGTGSLVLKGVSLGDHCVAAAGSIITASAPPRSLLAGNPAQVVRSIK